jgi:hypothetical protein
MALLGARILDEMTAPVSIGGRDDLRPMISIGVALSRPGVDGDALLSNADAALYRARALGGGRMCLFDLALRDEVVDRLNITTEFRVNTGDRGCDAIGWTDRSGALISDFATSSTAPPGSEPPRAGTPAPGGFAPSTG